MVLLGKQNGCFVDKTSGEVIHFKRLHVGEEGDDTEGLKVSFHKVAKECKVNVAVGEQCTLFFDKFGKVIAVNPID